MGLLTDCNIVVRTGQEKVFETREQWQLHHHHHDYSQVKLWPSQEHALGCFTEGDIAVWLAWVEGRSVKLKEELPKLVLFSSSHFQAFSSEYRCMDSSIGTQE